MTLPIVALSVLAVSWIVRLSFRFGRAVGAQDERTSHLLTHIDRDELVCDEADACEDDEPDWYYGTDHEWAS